MRQAPLLVALMVLVPWGGLVGAQTATAKPRFPQFETRRRGTAGNQIDAMVSRVLRQRGLQLANPCSDAVFLRRVYLDVLGTLPAPAVVRRFLASRRRDKREVLIRELLQHDDFAHYWAMKWCDLLRVKAEFPINLWPNAVQAYHRWIEDSLAQNLPYDRFARALLTSSGSNFRVPPVNFYRAIQGHEPSALAGAVALTFMGVRFEKWPKSRRQGMAAFFSRVAFKPTAEWKEEIIHLDPQAATALRAVFPDGTAVVIPAGEDPRAVFADWLIAADNPWFTRNIVNRVWAWLMGHGFIHEPDDIRPDNPPVHPKVLAWLEKSLVRADYDLRHLFRLILESRTYQQSSIPQSDHPDAEALFACYPVRRLEAEVLLDALCWITGSGQGYSSPIPEPFTFVPARNRSIELADGSITSQFLEMFGRPPRDTGLESERNNEPTDAQRLHLLNSSFIQTRIERSQRLRAFMRSIKGDRPKLISGLYMTILSRPPTAAELSTADGYFAIEGINARQATADLIWALINTKEFLYRH